MIHFYHFSPVLTNTQQIIYLSQRCMRQEQQGLLGNKDKRDPKEYKRRFDECDLKVKILKNQNAILQKQCDNQLEGNIREVVKLQGQELERETNDIKKLLYKLSRDYTDHSSKLKIKELWNTSGKQIEKNKRIMEEFINKAAASQAFLKRIQQNPIKRFSKTELQGQQLNDNNPNQPREKEGVSMMQGGQIQGELLIQQRAMVEKVALLQEVQERNNKINLLFNDMRLMVEGQQREPVQQANDNLGHNNLIHGESVNSKAGRANANRTGKLIAMVVVFVVVILLALGIIYILVG